MDKLKLLIEQHGRWKGLEVLIERIEAHVDIDFILSLENAKSLLETIGRKICTNHGLDLPNTSSTNAILKKAFIAIGYSGWKT